MQGGSCVDPAQDFCNNLPSREKLFRICESSAGVKERISRDEVGFDLVSLIIFSDLECLRSSLGQDIGCDRADLLLGLCACGQQILEVSPPVMTLRTMSRASVMRRQGVL